MRCLVSICYKWHNVNNRHRIQITCTEHKLHVPNANCMYWTEKQKFHVMNTNYMYWAHIRFTKKKLRILDTNYVYWTQITELNTNYRYCTQITDTVHKLQILFTNYRTKITCTWHKLQVQTQNIPKYWHRTCSHNTNYRYWIQITDIEHKLQILNTNYRYWTQITEWRLDVGPTLHKLKTQNTN